MKKITKNKSDKSMSVYWIGMLIFSLAFFGRLLTEERVSSWILNKAYPFPAETQMVEYYSQNKKALGDLESKIITYVHRDGLLSITGDYPLAYYLNPEFKEDFYGQKAGYTLGPGLPLDLDEKTRDAVFKELKNDMKSLNLKLYGYQPDKKASNPSDFYEYETFDENRSWYLVYTNGKVENYFSADCDQPSAPVENITTILNDQYKYCLYNNYMIYRKLDSSGLYLLYTHTK